MPELLSPEPSGNALDPGERDSLRSLNRSPHPYHHQNFDLPYPADVFGLRSNGGTQDEEPEEKQNGDGLSPKPARFPSFSKESSAGSDSGTEADDEHFLKGLPAPKTKPHKGLRGRNEPLSGSVTPLLSPSIPEEEDSKQIHYPKTVVRERSRRQRILEALRRKRIWVRRATEFGLVGALGLMVRYNDQVSPIYDAWSHEFMLLASLFGALLAIYPLRVTIFEHRRQRPSRVLPLGLPLNFEPAPLLYPPTTTLLVALLVSTDNLTVVLPNIILSICTLPYELIPTLDNYSSYDSAQWALTCLPLLWCQSHASPSKLLPTLSLVSDETMTLLYPLHRLLCDVLQSLTTTSLLPAELQLLSVALVNVLILAASPQVQIIKSLLWVGGLGIMLLCGTVIKWAILLARVPRWRFRRASVSQKPAFFQTVLKVLSSRGLRHDLTGSGYEDSMFEASLHSDEDDEPPVQRSPRVLTFGPSFNKTGTNNAKVSFDGLLDDGTAGIARRHTLSHPDKVKSKSATHTATGRRKRQTSMSIRPLLRLTYTQAVLRRWLYALYVYACMAVIILAGVRTYIERFALYGMEPIGWALGYFFGDIPQFRFQVVQANLERWICLPERSDDPDDKQCEMGWVQRLRHNDFGEASTRLVLAAYWVGIIFVGLLVVFRLKETYEVDTRRKVFHFMMVGMFLPAIFVDPTYAALALAIVLAVFLVLDLLRASQLPPLSKPIASFLAPFADGRDFRGPVVISHIFLLIGCAIPLWLALGSLPRGGSGNLRGWEVPTREVSMVAGVICVGLGDAAASLIGRRYGHRKWLWGGGKSLEGSLAFAVAVFIGLGASSLWLRIGGWPASGKELDLLTSGRNAAVCGSVASLTEAVLTGGNDNVIVPVVLWTCVKSLGV